ncbi:MAG TPA: triose-phosphate isomerase, partial [Rhizobiaceae bacterium]|nr:triose-phosphate isomerase [Rhizobiaceae bacterium]
MTPGIRPLIAGNWKMNGLKAQLPEIEAISTGFAGHSGRMDGLVCVPFTLIGDAARVAAGSALDIGGQDCHANASGAHTGDISAEMLADSGATSVIVGHSERRTDHGETSGTVKAKAEAALRAGILPIVCIGETRAQREAGETLDVLKAQLEASLPAASDIVIAYEPVWAIGTGLTPTVKDVAEAHRFIREFIGCKYGE